LKNRGYVSIYEKCRGYSLNVNTKSRVREICKHGSVRGGDGSMMDPYSVYRDIQKKDEKS
jgi:hypothetical protein